MGKKLIGITIGAIAATVSLFFLGSATAATTMHHKVVIQISSIDPITQKITLNNAINLQELYGEDNVTIEIVAFGPGINLLTENSHYENIIGNLIMQDITFSACSNTMEKIKEKTGKLPVLLDEVKTVTSGAARIVELQEIGYAYIRP